ncbi:MAG: hypothetical protein JSR59_18385 [Proteobacteria bacterium]|nr:hypothetical protein [Pseudomonadota bacterium]
MKQYRLTAWPDLRAPFQRTAYRRILNDMSQRYVTLSELAGTSGLRRRDVRQFVDMLCDRGMVGERKADAPSRLAALLPMLRLRRPALLDPTPHF